jgi:hypothetical protein
LCSHDFQPAGRSLWGVAIHFGYGQNIGLVFLPRSREVPKKHEGKQLKYETFVKLRDFVTSWPTISNMGKVYPCFFTTKALRLEVTEGDNGKNFVNLSVLVTSWPYLTGTSYEPHLF